MVPRLVGIQKESPAEYLSHFLLRVLVAGMGALAQRAPARPPTYLPTPTPHTHRAKSVPSKGVGHSPELEEGGILGPKHHIGLPEVEKSAMGRRS